MVSIKLRSYQSKGIAEIKSKFAQGFKKICLVMPCGAGKTRMMEHMASEAEKRNKHTIFLVHRRELISQAAETFREDKIDFGIIAPGYPMLYRAIQIASVQTISRRLNKIIVPELVIPDECHHSVARTWKTCFDYWPDAYLVGLTATPARLGGQGLGDVFDNLVIGPTARDLIQQGHLCGYKYYAPPQVADFEGVKIKMGDFDSEEIEIRVNKPKVIGDAIEHYVKLANGKQAIVYCASILHSQNTATAFQEAGIVAKHIDGTTPAAERDQAIEDFRAGKITVLCNRDLIGEGFDVPSMEVVILLRPTQSLTLYIQQSMRPLRPDRNNFFKEAIILDHVGNVFRHGLPDAEREWTLEGVSRSKRGEASAVGVRQCPNCFMCHEPAPICPICGYEYQMTARQLAEEVGELKEFDAFAAEQARRKKRIELNCCKTIADLKQYAKENDYAPGWVWMRARLKHIRS